MKIFYYRTGTERKLLAASIGQELNKPVNYLYAPSFGYEVGDYHIDKNGVLEGPDNPGLVADLQGLYDFIAVSAKYDTPAPEPVPENSQILNEAELGGKVSPYRDYEEPPVYSAPEDADMNEPDTLTIEMPLEGFSEDSIANLEKLIASKASLIKKALGVDLLPIERTESKLRFPWFVFGTPGEDIAAYARFIGALYAAAKKQQRVTAREKQVENEKFAFRVFLIRLGFVGDDYKAARKILLRNLSGNSAFKVAPRAEEVEAHE